MFVSIFFGICLLSFTFRVLSPVLVVFLLLSEPFSQRRHHTWRATYPSRHREQSSNPHPGSARISSPQYPAFQLHSLTHIALYPSALQQERVSRGRHCCAHLLPTDRPILCAHSVELSHVTPTHSRLHTSATDFKKTKE